MADFTPRLSKTGIYLSKYYYDDNPFYQAGYGLPNCTCYAWGRFYEISDVRPDNLPLGDGGDWYPSAVSSGYYKTGNTPALGAVACYSSTTGDAGHVAIVEVINSDGSFTISQSGYYRPIASYPPDTNNYFWTNECDATSKKAPWMGNYAFQGFIYNPEQPVTPLPKEWIAKNAYLTRDEMENNALLVWSFLGSRGWSREAVSAMLGNMQTESTINPGIWESLNQYSGGYGLVQWTPYTKYSEWAGSGWENNGNKQCERINYEMENGLQWFSNNEAPIVNPPITFEEFSKSTDDVGTLANYFLWYYEHPATTIQPDRAEQAKNWYEFLAGVTPSPTPSKKKNMPLWMYLRYF